MTRERIKSLYIIVFLCILSIGVGIIFSRKMATFSLWIMPALFHLYPIATLLFVVIYSVIASKKIFWPPLLVLLGVGLVLECLLFWITKHYIFASPKLIALLVLGLLVLVYGVTWTAYLSIVSRKSP